MITLHLISFLLLLPTITPPHPLFPSSPSRTMSVAVSRQPAFSPSSTTSHRRMPAPRAPSAPAAIVPGLIRLQAGTTTSAQRPSRSRQRKQQNRQSQDGTPHAFSHLDTPNRDSNRSDSAPTLSSSKERTSPKRAPQQAQARQQPHQHHQHVQNQQHQSAKKQMPPKQPLPASTQQRTPPRSPTRARSHPHNRSQQRPQDVQDMFLSSADDSDDAFAPIDTPSRVVSAPTAVAAEPAGRLARSRRNHNKDREVIPAGAGAVSEPILPTSASIPIARSGRSGHTRSVTSTDPFLSRSVPSNNALPDWDLPASFGSSSGGNFSDSSDLTTTMATNMHQLSQSMSQLPMPSASPQHPVRPAPRPSTGGTHSEQRFLVPWIETLEDEEERAAALGASAPLMMMNRPQRAGIVGNPGPSTPTRPVRRHARTASVPSLGSPPRVQRIPLGIKHAQLARGIEHGSSEQVRERALPECATTDVPANAFVPGVRSVTCSFI